VEADLLCAELLRSKEPIYLRNLKMAEGLPRGMGADLLCAE